MTVSFQIGARAGSVSAAAEFFRCHVSRGRQRCRTFLSSGEQAQMPVIADASSATPSVLARSSIEPLFAASSENFISDQRIGHDLLQDCLGAIDQSLAAGTTSLTRPMRQASWAEIKSPVRIRWCATPCRPGAAAAACRRRRAAGPSFTSGCPNLACSTGRNPRSCRPSPSRQPPPSAKPLDRCDHRLAGDFRSRSSTPCPNRLDLLRHK